MVIDTCTYIGHWPFRKLPCETLAETAARAEKAKITHIVCTNLNAIFYIDAMEGNRELLRQLRDYRGSVTVLPFAVAAVRIIFSVAPTLGKDNVILHPSSSFKTLKLILANSSVI